MGFIGYIVKQEKKAGQQADDVVRVFLECREEPLESRAPKAVAAEPPPGISYTYAVDFVFPEGKSPCRLRGVEEILALKKFYKLVFSLEERAREHGNRREKVLESMEVLLEHLRYTRNVRDLANIPNLSRRSSLAASELPDCGVPVST